MRNLKILSFLSALTLTVAAGGPVSAQSVDDLLQPGNKKPGGPGASPGTTPGGGGGGGGGGAGRPQPTEDDYLIATSRPWTTAHAIARVIQKMGYVPAIRYNRNGIPNVRMKVEGKLVIVFFYGCSKHPVKRCLGVQIGAGYTMNAPIPLERLNLWHARNRYTYAYRLTRRPQSVWLLLDLTFSAGMTPQIFQKHFEYFRQNEQRFRKHIGFRL